MEKITEKLDLIIKQVESDKSPFEQLTNFEDTIKDLQKLIPLEKPAYIFPHVDTVGKSICLSLNKK